MDDVDLMDEIYRFGRTQNIQRMMKTELDSNESDDRDYFDTSEITEDN